MPPQPATPRKKTSTVPGQPDITPAWLEALTNRKNAATQQTSTRPNPGMGGTVDGGKYGTYDSNKWGGLYGLAVDAAKVGDFLVGNPAKSMWRTLKGENANTAFNPNSGASITQRLGAFGEDAMNVASVFPAMRAAGAARNPFAQVRLPKTMTAPPTYEYGIHTSAYPNIKGSINSAQFTNMGGAGDALPNSSYQWRLSPQTGLFSNAEMANRATPSAQNWAARLMDRTMMDDSEAARITQYLTRGPASKAGPDLNLSPKYNIQGQLQGMESLYENTGSVVGAPLEILGKVPYNPDQEAYAQAIQNMIASRKRQISDNNVRLLYERGLLPKGYNLPPNP
jgi:hypothetical protein